MDRATSLIATRFARILRKRTGVERLMLFGSRARGDHLKTSDFDFVAVSDKFEDIPFPRRASLLLRHWDASLDADFLCYTPREWARLKDKRGILLQVQKEGVRL